MKEPSPEQERAAREAGVPATVNAALDMPFVLVPGGSFRMGSVMGEWYRCEDETAHTVTLSRPYYLGRRLVTNAQYRRFRPEHESGDPRFDHDDQPVVAVSYDDAMEFAAWLSSSDPRRRYRLPTEAEWERACRAGSDAPYGAGEYDSAPGERAWTRWYSGGGTHDVGDHENPWGLSDMLGNVWEWCSDWFGDYPRGPVTDPAGPATGRERSDELGRDERVVRGGCYESDEEEARCACRGRDSPSRRDLVTGIRLAFDVPRQAR